MGSNFRVFRDTEPFHEYLTHENLLSWVEFEQYGSKKRNFDRQKWNIDQNTKIRPHENIPLYGI